MTCSIPKSSERTLVSSTIVSDRIYFFSFIKKMIFNIPILAPTNLIFDLFTCFWDDRFEVFLSRIDFIPRKLTSRLVNDNQIAFSV